MVYRAVKPTKICRRTAVTAGVKQVLAVVLAFAMVFSGIPIGTDFAGGGAEVKAAMSVPGENTPDAKQSRAVSGSGVTIPDASGEYALDTTISGNVTDVAQWTASGENYKYTDTNSPYVQENGVFSYICTLKSDQSPDPKIVIKSDDKLQLDGSVGSTGKAGIQIDLTNVPEGEYELLLKYRAKGSNAAIVQVGELGALSAANSQNASTADAVLFATVLNSGKIYLIGAKNGMLIDSLALSKREESIVSGTVSCYSGTTLPDTCSIIFKEILTVDENGEASSYGAPVEAEINIADGSYSAVVPASSFGTKYEVTFSDGNYVFNPEVTVQTINKGETTTIDATVQKVSSYVLSGSYTEGLDGNEAGVSALIFEPITESSYEVPSTVLSNGTYSVRLEKGTSYKVKAEGVNDYVVKTPESFSYNVDTTLDIVFEKKPTYAITVSTGTTPDLSTINEIYTFTHEDGSVYSFADSSAIALRDGTYTLSMGGDFEKEAYKIAKGETLTVAGKAMTHVLTFLPVTSWSFTGAFTASFERAIGYYQGLCIDATMGKLAPNGTPANSAQFNTGAVIKVPVSGACELSVTAYESKYALYTINGQQADISAATTVYSYTGEAGTVDIISTGSAYIASISVKYPEKEVEYVEQAQMPSVPEDDTDANTDADTDGIPRQNNKDSITVQPAGQKLNLAQTGGSFADKFADTKDVAYYLFPMTSDSNKLEFDLLVTESKATGNAAGFFGGLFTDNYVYSLGLRAGGQKIRGIYSKNGGLAGGSFAGAGSPAEEAVGLNRPIHYIIEKNGEKPAITITYLDDDGVKQTRSFSQGALTEPDGSNPTEFYYGFALANVGITITNMVYTAADGTVLYDQNSCYYPLGTAPAADADSVAAVAAESREYIDISWTGTVPEGDGTYVVEMKKDGGEWTELNQDITGFNYRYTLPEGEGGNYIFRVCGQLGKEALGGTRNAYAEMTEAIYVLGALAKPVVTTAADAFSITLEWQKIEGAEYYIIYRYSFDEGAENAAEAARVTEPVYTDTNVIAEMPYYYQVKAVSDSNGSPLSDVAWTVPTAGHTGDYVYEDEATEITVTKKSYDTVFSNEVLLEGTVSEEGTLTAYVNGTVAAEADLAAGGAFSFELTVQEGRNDVNLIFTDAENNKTRKTYNYVYLTNYDILVDAAYTGTDGEAVNGIPVYKTVQAAVDSVPAGNAGQTVILVLAGDYEERLVVNTPNISIIGEDRESTLIHFYPGVLGTDYEAGGDMKLRCAAYIQSGAQNFSAENISFKNDYVYSTPDGKSNKSADTLRCDAEASAFVNVKLTGVQDTLYMNEGHQYYYKCLIEGLVDYIYSGEKARSFFNDCELRFVYESTKNSGYVCAPKTAKDAEYGLTFYNCVITGEEGCSGTGYLLARPWGADAYIAWVNCYMGDAVNEAAPYGGMSGNLPENARFFEFGTYGPGFKINPARRQISPAKAAEMVSDEYLGWSPDAVIKGISADSYVGTVKTDRGPMYAVSEGASDTYLWTDGNDAGLKKYNLEGYAESYRVSGGGLLKETSENYYKVSTAEEFLNALMTIKTTGKKSVIELTADINLGCNEVENFASYSSVIKAYSAQPLTHPALIQSGVSVLNLSNLYNVTIFSSNASSIKHANITMKNAENIVIRNIKFDELWEWDEATGGDYDRNDWDYMTIDSTCDGIWIDHCTFYKAYDGIVDVKNPNPVANVTISWCEFLPGSEGDTFFNAMMDEIKANPSDYPSYQHMLEAGMSESQIYMYAYGQKKTHLLGQSDDAVNAAGIRVTLANNYYKNSMDRMPRLRYGYSHVYNCIMDAQDLLDVKNTIQNEEMSQKIVSNGAASTCEAQVLLENCYISGILNALNSGNGSSPSGYINAINSVYYLNGEETELAPKCNTTGDTRVLVTDAEEFISGLPYSSYVLYEAEDLDTKVMPYTGAGKLDLTVLQWEKAAYNDQYAEPEDPVTPEEPEIPEESDDSDDSGDSGSSSSGNTSTTGKETVAKTEDAEDEGDEGTWKKNDKGWWFEYYQDGSYAQDSWHKINGEWYAFDKDGYMETGWLFDAAYGSWFYLDESGAMQTGWVLDPVYGSWFHLDESGAMQTGWMFDQTYGGWFYLEGNGIMKTGWHLDAAKNIWYYLKPNGIMAANETTPDGYQVNADGIWVK